MPSGASQQISSALAESYCCLSELRKANTVIQCTRLGRNTHQSQMQGRILLKGCQKSFALFPSRVPRRYYVLSAVSENLGRVSSSACDYPQLDRRSSIYDTRLKKDELRLPCLVPSQYPSAAIGGTLKLHSRLGSIRYQALSYTWGNPHARALWLRNGTATATDPYDQNHIKHEVLIEGLVDPVSLNLF